MKPRITVARSSQNAAFQESLAKLRKVAVFVGIPASTGQDRQDELRQMAETAGKKRKARIQRALRSGINNAELLFIHSKGSELRGIPARPVIEPAIEADDNREAISAELATAAQGVLEHNPSKTLRGMKRAGLAGQNASRDWFTDPRNNWPENAPSTIAEKGSERPLIDTGALRAAITYVIGEDTDD